MGNALLDEMSLENPDFISSILTWSLNKQVFEKWGKKGLLLAEKNMLNLIDLCKENNIKINIVIYPWPIIIYHKDLENIQVSFWREFCEKNKITLINLYPDFINNTESKIIINKYFIINDVHWNKEGHKLIADKLMKYILM